MITLLALSTVAGGEGSTAPAPTVPAAAGLERAVDDALAAPIRDRKFSGVVLVEKDGRPLLRKAYGLADRSRGTANTPETRFMIMSVSKQFTAALILRLAARGRLRLTDGVGEYLADWPAEWLAVTIHDLLSHSAGIDIDTAYAWLIAHHPEFWEPKAEARPVYTPRGLATPPGTKFLYSNVGYTLLSMIAASAGGKPFDELMREEVFRPLGLKNTEPERGTPVEGRACGYQRSDEGFDFSEQNTVDIVGAADLVSTVDDLAKLDEALADDRFLPAALRSAMFTPHVAGKGGGIGYGWFVRTREDGQALQFHSGSGAGFRAWNYRFPQAGLAVIILSNVGEEDSAWVLVVLDRIVNVLAAEKGRGPSR